MKISARNNWPATVDHVEKGPVSTEVQLRLESGDVAVATITTASANDLALAPGSQVRALVKASNVMVLAGDGTDIGISTRNRLSGQVTEVTHGTVHSMVALRTLNGTEITASITKASVEKLELAAGKAATALVKASDVLILTE